MPTASGTFSAFGNNFLGTFHPPLGTVKVTGNFSQSVPKITVSSASVTYANTSEFSGTYEVVVKVPPSFIGATTLDLLFQNSSNNVLHVTGDLDYDISSRVSIAGLGTWAFISL